MTSPPSPFSMFALIRHGAYQGYPDHLSEAGRITIESLAKSLKILGPWTSLQASPKIRTQETASIIAKALNLPIITDEALLEDGDPQAWLPPNVPNGTLLVTHAPTIRRIASRWLQALDLPEYQPLDVGTALIIDPEELSARLVGAS